MIGRGTDVLAQASAALADSLDLETTLNTVARLVAAILALVRDRIRS